MNAVDGHKDHMIWHINSSRALTEVKFMKYGDIPRAVDTGADAIRDDPLIQYTTDTPVRYFFTFAVAMNRNFAMLQDAHKSLWRWQRTRLSICQSFTEAVSEHRAFTINHGDAIVSFTPAIDKSRPHRGTGRIRGILKKLEKWLQDTVNKACDSKEQRRRRKESSDKLDVAINAAIGDQKEDMIYLASLATAPAKQGRGYGTMLVHAVTAIADEQSRTTWLCSSNIKNTGFYEYCGFSVIGEISLGDNNPTWTKPPVVVRIMVRKPQTSLQAHGKNSYV
ncbi:hypothetical protein AcW1_007708 [Taiwanofungus camphoratus]|nr:hypothetical protein AcW2_007231 [Antrodia cinnamomea]KAI0926900.1 hypothetical protein AcV5_007574 [Antrodia cinnamomea]KAI0947492.1 hypothetical protein AcV7_009909 [Antrodia cinnamomea]KAI0953508.1 hypothetical protein AcW1_007708 [Antrodia cinnamomea]